MGVLKTLLGKSTKVTKPENNPLITVYDQYGRELHITRDQWRTNILAGNLEAQWGNPDALLGIFIKKQIINRLGFVLIAKFS